MTQRSCFLPRTTGWSLITVLLLIVEFTARAQTSPYTFQPVTIGGGGYVTNITAHPNNADLMYIRTDVGGCYRWDASANRWIQLLNSLTPSTTGFNSVDGLAIAATDPNVVYIAAGNAQNEGDLNDVLKSTNQGKDWTRTNFNVNQAFEGNQRDVRYTGERIVVDPNNANYVYVGTKFNGLYRSSNGADNWSPISDIPGGTVNSTAQANVVGIRNIVCDPRQTTGSGADLRSKTIYVGAYEDGIYQSIDGGTSFTKMSGSPETPRRMVVATDGSLWVTTAYPQGSNATTLGGGRVYHYTGGSWVDKTPELPDNDKPYGAIAIAPDDNDRAIVAWQKNRSNQPIYRTENATAANPTWTKINPGPSAANKVQPGWWENHFFGTGPANILLDPASANELWMSDGFGVWNASDVWAAEPENITWTAQVAGIEELVMMTLATPPSPNPTPLFSGAADADGFAHDNLNQSPDETLLPGDWASTSLNYVASNPRHMVRLLTAKTSEGAAYWSEDSGMTWNKTGSNPRSGNITLGKAAVSATTLDRMVVVPAYNAWEIGDQTVTLRYTDDRGTTWNNTNLTFTPGPIDNWWAHDHPIVADKVDGNTFYFFYKRKSEFYRSTDGGKTFQLLYTFPNHEDIWGKPTKYWQQWVYVRTVPGQAGEVWINLPQDGLFKSDNGGESWTQVEGFENVRGLAFGKPSNDTASPSVYTLAQVGDDFGLFTSDDLGTSWFRCDDDDFNFGIGINDMRADQQTYGRVYIATGGRGIVQADRGSNPPPAVDFQPLASITVDAATGDKPLTVTFDASGSSDPDGGSLSYTWDFGDGNSGRGTSATHTYQDYGTYTATLTVTNNQGESATESTEIVVNAAPTVAWVSPADGASFAVGSTATLTVDASDANGAADINRVIFWDKDFNFLGNDTAGPDYTFDITIEAGPNEFYAEVYDQQNTKALTSLLVLVGGEASPSDWVYGVNAGGSGYQDTEGYLYYGDEHFTGGSVYTTTDDISSTTDDVLYQSERVGDPLDYSLPTGKGTFDVTLKLAELGWEAPGERVFDVSLEEVIVATDVDLYAVAGHDAAYDLTFEGIEVTDGSLNIHLEGTTRSPKINAMLITQSAGAGTSELPTGTTVTVYAAGKTNTEAMELHVDGQVVERWSNVGGNAQAREFIAYSYQAAGTVVASQVQVAFVNDDGGSRDLRVDKIKIGEVNYQSETADTYTTGTWQSGSACTAGYKQSEWLHCNGHFAYDQTNARTADYSKGSAESSVSEDVSMFPNPVHNVLHLRLPPRAGRVTVTLTDVLGREVLRHRQPNADAIELPVDKLPPGLYQLQVQQAGRNTLRKLLIE